MTSLTYNAGRAEVAGPFQGNIVRSIQARDSYVQAKVFFAGGYPSFLLRVHGASFYSCNVYPDEVFFSYHSGGEAWLSYACGGLYQDGDTLRFAASGNHLYFFQNGNLVYDFRVHDLHILLQAGSPGLAGDEGSDFDDFECGLFEQFAPSTGPKILTGRCYWRRPGGQYVDLGNTLKWKLNPVAEYVAWLTAGKGRRSTAAQLPKAVDWKWTLSLDEHLVENARLLALSQTPTEAARVTGGPFTTTLENVIPGRSYPIFYTGYPWRELTNVTVQVGGTARILGTDYTLDAAAGILTVLRTGTIVAGDHLAITFVGARGATEDFSWASELRVPGEGLILAYDALSEVPFCELTFPGEISIENRGEHDGQKLNEFEAVLLATAPPLVKVRQDLVL